MTGDLNRDLAELDQLLTTAEASIDRLTADVADLSERAASYAELADRRIRELGEAWAEIAVLREALTDAVTVIHAIGEHSTAPARPVLEDWGSFLWCGMEVCKKNSRLLSTPNARADVLLRVEKAAKALRDSPHVLQVREDGWGLQHPLRCRPRLWECDFNEAAQQLGSMPCDVGNYIVTLGEPDDPDEPPFLLIGEPFTDTDAGTSLLAALDWVGP